MAEPSSTTVSVLTSVTAAIHSSNSLAKVVDDFNDDDTTLSRLRPELEDLIEVLNKLQEPINLEHPIMNLLASPVVRCNQLCTKFENSMREFDAESKASFLDWSRMEFMKGNITDFMDILSSYKGTVSVGLGAIIMQTLNVPQQFLEEHEKKIKRTTRTLQIQLHRIDEKLALLMPNGTESSSAPDTSADLQDERAVTEQCLLICQNAKSHLQSLTDQEESPKRQMAIKDGHSRLETHVSTCKTLGHSRDRLLETIGQLKGRLDSSDVDGTPQNQRQRSLWETDLRNLREVMEGVKMASEVLAQRKIYSGGELEADVDSDQVLITTQADLFEIKKGKSTNRSAQWVGSSSDDTAQQIAKHRYGSRFGVMKTIEAPAAFREVSSPPVHRQDVDRHSAAREATSRQPEPNVTRKRGSGTGNGNANR
ncbi:uncharacterized protein CTRU02_215089 [Colletotrichum truncatum]|uniref:Uncharacterized protein n=1 Tax=Colletotrichum truncatum TaxID=5467 RepID=A0ACC3YDH5_COLTU|nr:uncharacterized protein CTRU02_13726 [Colletotrichum truncatum]KAF6783074.1 hypothetical protein CTRU02_13726 [Colletotrichum truncatum]